MMKAQRVCAAGAIALALAVAGCLDDSITGGRPLEMTLTADPLAVAVGASVNFSFEASGTDIGAVIIDYGDLTADTFAYPNPVLVADVVTHEYDAAGTYVAEGTVLARTGSRSDEVTITVN